MSLSGKWKIEESHKIAAKEKFHFLFFFSPFHFFSLHFAQNTTTKSNLIAKANFLIINSHLCSLSLSFSSLVLSRSLYFGHCLLCFVVFFFFNISHALQQANYVPRHCESMPPAARRPHLFGHVDGAVGPMSVALS